MKIPVPNDVARRMNLLLCKEMGLDPSKAKSLTLESSSGEDHLIITWEGQAFMDLETFNTIFMKAQEQE